MKKYQWILILAVLLLAAFTAVTFAASRHASGDLLSAIKVQAMELLPTSESEWSKLPCVQSGLDTNKNGISDTLDLIAGARAEISRAPIYRSAYYSGGYPPQSEGVCTDLIWRALQHAGYDLKKLMDADIKRAPAAYPRAKKPDPNIDFRRVPNYISFFKRHAQKLTLEIIPENKANLSLWQAGDIVTFSNPDHIVMLSDKRNSSGVPYILHNPGPVPVESDTFMDWYRNKSCITGHFRFPPK